VREVKRVSIRRERERVCVCVCVCGVARAPQATATTQRGQQRESLEGTKCDASSGGQLCSHSLRAGV
jgi:hypothetical protein